MSWISQFLVYLFSNALNSVNSLNQTPYQCQNYESFRESISENNLQTKNIVVWKPLKKSDHSRLLTRTERISLSVYIMLLLWIKRFFILKSKGSSKNKKNFMIRVSRYTLEHLSCHCIDLDSRLKLKLLIKIRLPHSYCSISRIFLIPRFLILYWIVIWLTVWNKSAPYIPVYYIPNSTTNHH